MDNETRIEVIKALALDQNVEDIANFAEVTVEEIELFKLDYAVEIEARRKAAEDFGI